MSELLITLVTLVGGGAMMYLFRDNPENFKAILAIVSSSISLILSFWFNRRQTEKVLDYQSRGYLADGTLKDPGSKGPNV